MYASRTAVPLHLPWLSWLFLALLVAASMFVRAGYGMKTPSARAAASHVITVSR